MAPPCAAADEPEENEGYPPRRCGKHKHHHQRDQSEGHRHRHQEPNAEHGGPRNRDGSPIRAPQEDAAAVREVREQPRKLAVGSGTQSAVYPLLELVRLQPALAGCLAQPVDDRVAIGIRRPQRVVASHRYAKGSAHTVACGRLTPERMRRKALLGCGILSSLVYVAANVVGARRWKDYFSNAQTVSELSAIGAPSRPVVIPLLTTHGALVIPFGLGVYESAGRQPALRRTGALLVGLGASDLSAPLFPMHRREQLARGEGSRTDTMHIVLTGVNSLLILLAIGFGSTAFGRRFRLYSAATILVLVVTGGLTAAQASRLEANLPTPWAGLMERISIGGYLLWQVVLAIALSRTRAKDRP
jgi:hypothetical protein